MFHNTFGRVDVTVNYNEFLNSISTTPYPIVFQSEPSKIVRLDNGNNLFTGVQKLTEAERDVELFRNNNIFIKDIEKFDIQDVSNTVNNWLDAGKSITIFGKPDTQQMGVCSLLARGNTPKHG
jgi:hypothetical protein